MNITFIGAGYVGLVSGTMISYLGHNVTCIDNDTNKIAQLNQGKLTLYEPELEHYFNDAVRLNKLHFCDDYQSVKNADIVFITVGTPPTRSGVADISYVLSAVSRVQSLIKIDGLIVIKSTVPPGTCANIVSQFAIAGRSCHIASNPEFLQEGRAVKDFLKPDRIVIGTDNSYAEQILTAIYKPILIEGAVLVNTDLTTSELIKYVSNAFLATKVAFINEMANICEKVDANITTLSHAVGLDRRIGSEFLKAGPGFGGSCFPKDILALSQFATQHNTESLVVNAVITANQRRYSDIVKKISDIMGGLSGVSFALLGLAFKADTDDIRHSPAVEIAKLLLAEGAIIKAYDPVCIEVMRNNIINMKYANSALEACVGADAMIVATEWQEFSMLDFDAIYQQLNLPIIIDLRNMLDGVNLKRKGFKYYSIGRKYHE